MSLGHETAPVPPGRPGSTDQRRRWSRILCVVGIAAMALGCLDPLEGSLVILSGSALVATAAILGSVRRRNLACWAFGAIAVGVGVLFFLSGLGGVGATSGRSNWWLLTVLPYPVGAILAFIGGVSALREIARRGKPPAAPGSA